MMQIENISTNDCEGVASRRGFLKGMLGAGAFVLSVRLMPQRLLAGMNGGASDAMTEAPLHPNVYLAIGTDGTHSVRSFFSTLRECGATARLMLVRAAAAQWGVAATECATNLHTVVHKPSGKKLGYGELAAAAAKLEVPKKEDVQLKPRSEWRYIGKGAASYDLKDMCTGKAKYGQDTRMEGMLYASVAHPPVFGSSVKSVDDTAALSVTGVKQTVTIDAFKPPIGFQALGGVAVLADNTWAAMQGKKKLKVDWEKSPHSVWNSDAYRKELQETARKPGKVVRENGNVEAEFSKGGKIIEADYYAPLLAHASMEPPAA